MSLTGTRDDIDSTWRFEDIRYLKNDYKPMLLALIYNTIALFYQFPITLFSIKNLRAVIIESRVFSVFFNSLVLFWDLLNVFTIKSDSLTYFLAANGVARRARVH